LDVFTFPLVAGDSTGALNRPGSVLITERMARKYFGDANPLHKTIRIENRLEYQVTGVLRDCPDNSHIKFDFLAGMDGIENVFAAVGTPARWLELFYWTACNTYVLLPKADARAHIEQQLPAFVEQRYPDHLKSYVSLSLQPVTDIHLHSHLDGELDRNGDVRMVVVFSVAALLVLLIALVNWANLSMATAMARAKEVSLRKVHGANRRQLIGQFLFELAVWGLVAYVVAVMIAELATPFVSDLTGARWSLDPGRDWFVLLGLLLVVMGGSIGAGLYPALMSSAIKPVQALRSRSKSGPKGTTLQRLMLVGQFAAAITLTTAVLAIYMQMKHLSEMDLGFSQSNVVEINLRATSLRVNADAFRDELRRGPGITRTCLSSATPGVECTVNPYRLEGHDELVNLPTFFVDHDFLETLQVQLNAGRNFSAGSEADQISPSNGGAFIVTETAARYLGWDEPLGKKLSYGRVPAGEVIGVVSDFAAASAREPLGPIILAAVPAWYDRMLVRIEGPEISAALKHIEDTWATFVPDRPLVLHFLDDRINRLYNTERQLGNTTVMFTILAVVVACMGLFGLASIAASRRTKEIGIRRAMGASFASVLGRLTREYLIMVAAALAIAWPVSYWVIQKWLESFAFRFEPTPGLFVLAGSLVLIMALGTVAYHTLGIARANPVEALRYE
jgi:putative ABC transport system permease protein